MKNIVIFGAGKFARIAISLMKIDEIAYVVDNDKSKSGTFFNDLPIFFYDTKKDELKTGKYKLIIAVSEQYEREIQLQLANDDIVVTDTVLNMQFEHLKKINLEKTNYIKVYNAAIRWIDIHSIDNDGIAIHSEKRIIYPEVTGYYICTLLKWGYKDKAVGFAKWLINVQREDGSWTDPSQKNPYVFDSAQILKGLIAIRNIIPEVDECIIKGCEWIVSNIDVNGRLRTPVRDMWGDKSTCTDLVHIYCLSPLMDAAKIYNKPEYSKAAYKVLNYYKNNFEYEIKNFGLLSHFYAYILEGLLDMGEVEWVKEAMKNMELFQKSNGEIPAYNGVNWVCSTGLFQLALIWFRLGNSERGNKTFEYACKLQNLSGGWFGSYLSVTAPEEKNTYFPDEEISWVVKYFLDALYYKKMLEFNNMADMFIDKIGFDDGRYVCIRDIVKELKNDKQNLKILDIGCGKGRYLVNLKKEFPNIKYYGIDLSEKVLKYIETKEINVQIGSLTCIPYLNDKFDMVYACESLEHAIDIKSAVRELFRVTKQGGIVAILDKNKEKLGMFEIEEWEQWFDGDELKEEMLKYCSDVKIIKNISYENKEADGLFYCWIGIKK